MGLLECSLNAIPPKAGGDRRWPDRRDTALEHLTILLADDEGRTAAGFATRSRRTASSSSREADDAAAAIAAASRLRPDICLIELELPGDGLNAIGRIAKASPEDADRRPQPIGPPGGRRGRVHARRLRLPAEGDQRRAARRDPPRRVSRRACRSRGRSSPTSSTRSAAARAAGWRFPDGPVTLTPREWEVGELLRDGHSTAEIADRLGVSPVTVRRHVGLLLSKLGAESRTKPRSTCCAPTARR